MEKLTLNFGLNFTVLPKTLQYDDDLLPFELLYCYIHNLDNTNEKKEVLKTRIRDCVFSSFNSYNEKGAPLTLTLREFATLKSLWKIRNLIIQKLDKTNSVVIIDKNDYLEKKRNILSGSSKFSQVSEFEDKQLNFVVNIKKHIAYLLKDSNMYEVVS